MVRQQTLGKSFTLNGVGLHTGVNTRVTFHPAPENHGYKIQRVDLPTKPIIDALAENVVATTRGTAIGVDGVSVGTIEHAMAALYACEIDNCLIEVDTPEFPILDGSSILYVKNIKEVGTCRQEAERKFIYFPRKKFKVSESESGASMQLIPIDGYSLECNIAFDSPLLRKQKASLENLNHFAREIASARTFVFVKEIRSLVQKGLIKGGDLDNAIVIYDSVIPQAEYNEIADLMGVEHRDAGKVGYIMSKPLLFVNEPARHKLLDIMGDLALVGGFIRGRIIANRPGHAINNQLAREIREYCLEYEKLQELKSKTKRGRKKKVEESPSTPFWGLPRLAGAE